MKFDFPKQGFSMDLAKIFPKKTIGSRVCLNFITNEGITSLRPFNSKSREKTTPLNNSIYMLTKQVMVLFLFF